MDRIPEQSSEILLARINRELERISDTQHRLARRKSVLQEQATRLRLGASPTEVRMAIRAVEPEQDPGRAWPGQQWARDRRPADRRERYGGSLL
jgi:hypothetical protein